MDTSTVIMDAVTFANISIGKKLCRRREEAGLTQAEVARKAKIRPEMLCRIESGNGNPTVATVAKIVRAIKMLSK
jgi:transcriptional regulator with XRE-family HTH domain